MILTHLVAFKFFQGASATAAVASATGPLCFEAVQVVSPWVEEVQLVSPWVESVQITSPWIDEVQTSCK